MFWVALVAALVVVGLVSGRRGQSGDPLDPDSTEPLGTHALLAFLDEFGVEVQRDVPDESTPTTLLLSDRLTGDQRADLWDWIEAGGTLVVTDPGSPFGPGFGLANIDNSGELRSGACDLPPLDGLVLEAGSFGLYRTDQADANCFGEGDEAYVHLRSFGDGTIVALGGGLPLTNGELDEGDNAALVAALLIDTDRLLAATGGEPGEPGEEAAGGAGGTVAVLYEPVFTPGSRDLLDLVPSSAIWSAWQLIVALAIYLFWRARRFGDPVTEPQPVKLPGSLLVRATGELHRRGAGYAQASVDLRADLDRRVRRRLRVSPELPADDLSALAASTLGLDPTLVSSALSGGAAIDGRELSDLVATIDVVNGALLVDDDLTGRIQQPVGEPT